MRPRGGECAPPLTYTRRTCYHPIGGKGAREALFGTTLLALAVSTLAREMAWRPSDSGVLGRTLNRGSGGP
jgi:hypothetical protein